MTNLINKQAIAIIFLFLIVSTGLYFGLGRPRLIVFKERHQAVSQSQETLTALAKRVESLRQLKKDEQRIEQALEKAKNILPKQKETSDFLVQLESAARETGNNIKSIDMKEEASINIKEESKNETGQAEEKKTESKNNTGGQNKNIVFTINLGGKFSQLLNFLALSESFSRFTKLTSLGIVTTEDNSIETRAKGEIYYQ